MKRCPFGINRLDSIIKGGAPPGSVVLLSGEAGAGAREFMYTSAVMNSLAKQGHDLFDLHYGEVADTSALPNSIHYISFTSDEAELRQEITMAMDSDVAEPALDGIEFQSLSRQYFHISPVPRDWYAAEAPSLKNLRKRHEEREGLLAALGRELSKRAPGSLVVIDSLSDLVSAIGEDLEWRDITYLITGIQKAAYDWGGLILMHVSHDTLTDQQLGQFVESCNGAMRFNWETGGSTRARTLVVQHFRGVLSQIEEEDIVKFETDLGEAGFDISDIRKIR